MADPNKIDLEQLGRDVHEWFSKLSAPEQVDLLKSSGILDQQGKVSSSYGGDGQPTRGLDNAPTPAAQ